MTVETEVARIVTLVLEYAMTAGHNLTCFDGPLSSEDEGEVVTGILEDVAKRILWVIDL
jgi:hypothetical protein